MLIYLVMICVIILTVLLCLQFSLVSQTCENNPFCKICQKLMKKLYLHKWQDFWNYLFSEYQSGFCKWFSAQNCFLAMFEKEKKLLKEKLPDLEGHIIKNVWLSRPWTSHRKIECLWICVIYFLKLFHNYLSNREQSTKINSS